ncbi:MAG TPA: type II toxin-antitoxin system VapC family toxin [Micromonosporaceae bacterium]|nr:type II toxin-antitoxin system VapC family toxin [Micromonosporaceae bacterium]
MIVVDASVLTTALAYADDRGRRARSVLARDIEWAAPEHWKAEVFSAVRGLTLTGQISETQAFRVVDRIPRLGVDHVSLDRLLPRVWQLRATLGAFDAPYVALAEARGITLVTADPPLARAAVAHCRVELVG